VRCIWALLAVAACGRLEFDAITDARVVGTDVLDCNGPGVLLCEDFESGLTRWTRMFGVVSTSSVQVHAGSYALEATIPTGGSAYLDFDLVPIVTSGELHARAWFYFPSGQEVRHVDVLWLWANPGGAAAYVYLDGLSAWDEATRQALNTGTTVVRDRWLCVALDVVIDATAGLVAVNLDGAEQGRLSGLNTTSVGGWDLFSVGLIQGLDGQPAMTMYVDDVALGTVPLACP
jgi:hypothetical protein